MRSAGQLHAPTADRNSQSGQILVIFTLALVTLIAVTGLIIDGGGTFVQRRDMQNAADASALAAAYAYGNSGSTDAATAAAEALAATNRYPNGEDGSAVSVTFDAPGGAGRHLTVTITKPHENAFSGVMGMPRWGVAATATVIAGRANTALGAMPIIFNQDVLTLGLGQSGDRAYDEPVPGNGDIPFGTDQFNWTEYCDECNADSKTVENLITDHGYVTQVTLDDKISPLNAGAHTTLFAALAKWVGTAFPVPLVDDAGRMVGWAMFHITGSSGGSTKQIRGWFDSSINPSNMTITDGVSAGSDTGVYIIQLVN
jgi:Flp pilus assembly protein TadG